MRKISKLWIIPLMICMMVGLLLPGSVFAKDNSEVDSSYLKYEQYINDGILGDDVSFEEWKILVESSYRLEEELSNSINFQEVYSSRNVMLRSSFSPKKGDVIITNGTSSAGILGHAGIATSSGYVFHIADRNTTQLIFLFPSGIAITQIKVVVRGLRFIGIRVVK